MLREVGRPADAAQLLLEAGVASGHSSGADGGASEAAQLELAVCYLQMGELEAAKAVAGEAARTAKVGPASAAVAATSGDPGRVTGGCLPRL